MEKKNEKMLSLEQCDELFSILKARFEKNRHRHKEMDWDRIENKLRKSEKKCWSLNEMERTGGEPDVIGYDAVTSEYIFCDCSPESPAGRRSLCYDRQALDARKEFKPENSALDMSTDMGVELLSEEEYRLLQSLGKFDTKTSSWIRTPDDIHKLGGAVFVEFRYGHVFVFHNGASSYYAARGFRGLLKI
jgi:hypothetical protein